MASPQSLFSISPQPLSSYRRLHGTTLAKKMKSLDWCSQKSLCFPKQKRDYLVSASFPTHLLFPSFFLPDRWICLLEVQWGQQWSNENEEKPRALADITEHWEEPEPLMAGPPLDFVLCMKNHAFSFVSLCLGFLLFVAEYHLTV